MAANSRLKKVARAYADDAPNLHDLAQAALHDIETAKSELTAEAQAIRSLVALAPRPRPTAFQPQNPESPTLLTERMAQASMAAGPGLSDAVKERIAALWRAEKVGRGLDLGASEIISRLNQEGYPLNVQIPGMAVGTVLRRVRREFDENGQGRLVGEGG